MERFTRLFVELDETNRTNEKVRALQRYFSEADARDAAWALYFLTGQKISRAVSTTQLREWTVELTGFQPWLLEECYDAVGDLAEALALLLPDTPSIACPEPLHQLVEQRLLPLRSLPDTEKRAVILRTWADLDSRQRFVWNKLITGSFRVGVARTLVERALAAVANIEPAIMAHRLMGHWRPTAEDYERIMEADGGAADPRRPYPFYLAHPLEDSPESLGEIANWQIEWKWDGIRAQLIRRGSDVMLWSRGEELITERFPEISDLGRLLPDGTVLDGEVLAWSGDRPLPFGALQRRIGRKTVGAKLLAEVPAAFMVYDALEFASADVRSRPLAERREILQQVVENLGDQTVIRISPVAAAEDWDRLQDLKNLAREQNAEGLMIKRLSSHYGVGRVRGDWWKWKIDPYVIDAVLIYAQRGHGRRASLYTDYTFGLWENGNLVPVAKAYSGLTDAEIREVDAFIRRHTLERFGPVRVVAPVLVFELAFEGIQKSTRHKSGVAVRFPRMSRWRKDKKPEEADTLEALRGLLPAGVTR